MSGLKPGPTSEERKVIRLTLPDRLAEISPRDGHVIAWIDLAGILPDRERIDAESVLNGIAESVLNGIAYDAQQDRIFVTGKQWPWVFEIKVVRKAS